MRFRAFLASWSTVCLLALRKGHSRRSGRRDDRRTTVITRAKWSFLMSVIEAIKNGARPAALAIMLAAIGPAANAQQPSAAAMSTAKELIAVAGATSLFSPLIAGVVEQAKVLYPAAGSKSGEGPERDFGSAAHRTPAALYRAERRGRTLCTLQVSPSKSSRRFSPFTRLHPEKSCLTEQPEDGR